MILIGGGARSGKSKFAQELALKLSANPTYVATGQASDDEMAARINRHQIDRSKNFKLIEEPLELAKLLSQVEGVVLVDCLTLWLSNLLFAQREIDFAKVTETVKSRNFETIFVTNEVGEGIVPMHPVSREYRDLSGRMNQEFAAAADEVYFMKFGIAQRIK